MATKMAKANAHNGMHTAGIYSDMTVDGPEIGTLVVIVDRAKNLPNRKSIGKQDPYCAARLGKEAKKTETDRRGGQTPKWDQELRFTVHDSPDYYQMKVSVFNDDKKTDLIGETWVSLQEVVIPGGGQNDLWHNLNFKGKYAGEIRIEITYYDTRPKQEKAVEKTRQSASTAAAEAPRESMTGPRQPKPPAKRRPLPADPTGASPSPTGTPEQVQTPPRGFQAPQTFIHTQSPLQAMEYNTSPQNFSQSKQGYGQSRGPSSNYGPPPGMIATAPVGRSLQDDRYEIYDPAGEFQINDGRQHGQYEEHIEDHRANPQFRYDPHEMVAELPAPMHYESPHSSGGPPPPPPVHRSNHGSPAVSNQPPNGRHEHQHFNASRNVSFELAQSDNFRHSMPAYAHGASYQAYNPMRNQEVRPSFQEDHDYPEPAPRHDSYDERTSETYRSMQPTVEDDPSSPSAMYHSSHRNSDSRMSHYDDRRYDQVAPTAPLNLSGRASAASSQYSAPSDPRQQIYSGTSSSVSPIPYRDSSHLNSEASSQTSYSQASQHSQNSQMQRYQSDDQTLTSPSGYVPPIPPTLVPGMDPMIAKEVSERIYAESQSSYGNGAGSIRSRYPDQPQYRQGYAQPIRQSEPTIPYVPATASAVPFVPASATYDDRQSRIATGTYTPIVKPRAISPDPRVPLRKSVSPSIASNAPSPEGRRLSGIPFGPDAYDALNPNLIAAAPVITSSQEPNNNTTTRLGQHDDFEPGAKIIMHDGREVDPSDHLPETSWAPEPEARGPKQPESIRSRPTPSGAQPMPSSGPRPLRQVGRPQSLTTSASSPIYPTNSFSDASPTPAGPGRNRLQKKSNRNYIAPAPQSSPMAPQSGYHNSDFAPKGLPRAHTMDVSGGNQYGSYGSSSGGSSRGGYGRNSLSGPPPVPAKVPFSQGPPPMPPTENAWALLEEMKSIDLGNGRARRRGYENHAFA